MINVKDIDKEIFNVDFITLFPKNCKDCNSDMLVTDSLTTLICSNPNCNGKVKDRFNRMVRETGLKIEYDLIKDFIEKFNLDSPYYIFLYNPKKDGTFTSSSTIEESIEVYRNINSVRTMMLWEYIYIGFLPYIKESAEMLFKDYDDIEKFYSDLENEGMGFVQNLIEKNEFNFHTLNDDSILAQTILIYDTLNTYKKEIINGAKGIILPDVERYIPLFFVSNVSGFKYKKEMIYNLNTTYKGKYYFFRTYEINRADFVYWECPKNGSKTELMKYIDAYYREKDIVNYNELIEKIEKMGE